MSWRGRKPAGRNWGGSLKPFKTETGVTVRTVQAGDGIAHKIYDGKTYVGHISGFPDIRDSLRVYKTQVEDEHRGKGHWQSAIRKLADIYPGGVHLNKYELSHAGHSAARKVPGVEETDEKFLIKPRPRESADQLIRQKLEEGRKRQYFFHGTKARLRRGDLVMPASKVEGANIKELEATGRPPKQAIAMTRADHALDYAEVSHQEGKPVVYRVRSLGDHEPDPSDDSRGEYVRSRTGFRVMGKVRKP
jgi:hypothetical protein